MLLKMQKLLNDHKQHIAPVLTFTKRCLSDIVGMREKSNFIDYINLGFSFKENWEIAYNYNDPYTYFSGNPNWKFISGNMLGELICNLIMSSQTNRITPVVGVDSAAAFVCTMDGVKFGWVSYDERGDKLYVEKQHANTYHKVIEKIFWEIYQCQHVVLGLQDEEKITVHEDLDCKDFLISEKATLLSQDFQKFLDKGINRSCIFYGPPGTGKSNTVKNITSLLGLRTIRINNLSKFDSEIILDILRLFNPDAVILEDIDNVSVEEVSDLLDKVEKFNRRQKLILGTANQIHHLDEALIRPGRFDEAIEIKIIEKKVVRKIVNNDEEIFELVKEWPAAFIVELMKRVEVRGKAVALANYKDLTERIENLSETYYELKNPPRPPWEEDLDDMDPEEVVELMREF